VDEGFVTAPKAERTAIEKTLIRLNEPDWKAFAAALDSPPPATAELKALLTEWDPWKS
jgi:uncharacterized protein (DUF1778 family)